MRGSKSESFELALNSWEKKRDFLEEFWQFLEICLTLSLSICSSHFHLINAREEEGRVVSRSSSMQWLFILRAKEKEILKAASLFFLRHRSSSSVNEDIVLHFRFHIVFMISMTEEPKWTKLEKTNWTNFGSVLGMHPWRSEPNVVWYNLGVLKVSGLLLLSCI